MLMTFRTRQGSNYGIGRGRVGEPAMAELSRIRHISCQPRFSRRGRRFRQAKAANCPARTANQSPAEISAEAGLDKKYKVDGYKKVTDSSPRNIEYKQDRQLFGLRDKPITQHDALPNSEVPAKIIGPGRTRCLPAEASPLSS
ncbi:hypothetical protein V6N13_108149 [Hibiscus sabdariffa]